MRNSFFIYVLNFNHGTGIFELELNKDSAIRLAKDFIAAER